MYLSKNLKGDTACDLRFGELIVPKPLGGHCFRFEIWVAHFAKKLTGDIACDWRFGYFTLLKT